MPPSKLHSGNPQQVTHSANALDYASNKTHSKKILPTSANRFFNFASDVTPTRCLTLIKQSDASTRMLMFKLASEIIGAHFVFKSLPKPIASQKDHFIPLTPITSRNSGVERHFACDPNVFLLNFNMCPF